MRLDRGGVPFVEYEEYEEYEGYEEYEEYEEKEQQRIVVEQGKEERRGRRTMLYYVVTLVYLVVGTRQRCSTYTAHLATRLGSGSWRVGLFHGCDRVMYYSVVYTTAVPTWNSW